jgi:hypothetical protein
MASAASLSTARSVLMRIVDFMTTHIVKCTCPGQCGVAQAALLSMHGSPVPVQMWEG